MARAGRGEKGSLLPAQAAFAGAFFCPNRAWLWTAQAAQTWVWCQCAPHRHALLQVRVFTFSVGQHNYDVTPLQWMACANKGEQGLHLAGM